LLKTLTDNKDKLENEPLIELRLDIEQVIALICKEEDIDYDGLLAELDPDQVVDNLWRKESKGDSDE